MATESFFAEEGEETFVEETEDFHSPIPTDQIKLEYEETEEIQEIEIDESQEISSVGDVLEDAKLTDKVS